MFFLPQVVSCFFLGFLWEQEGALGDFLVFLSVFLTSWGYGVFFGLQVFRGRSNVFFSYWFDANLGSRIGDHHVEWWWRTSAWLGKSRPWMMMIWLSSNIFHCMTVGLNNLNKFAYTEWMCHDVSWSSVSWPLLPVASRGRIVHKEATQPNLRLPVPRNGSPFFSALSMCSNLSGTPGNCKCLQKQDLSSMKATCFTSQVLGFAVLNVVNAVFVPTLVHSFHRQHQQCSGKPVWHTNGNERPKSHWGLSSASSKPCHGAC